MRKVLRGLALAALVGACAAVDQPALSRGAPAAGQPQHLATEPLSIDTQRGPVRFTMEVAADDASREYGLMFRRAMPAARGMIFDFVKPQPTAFWMRNTLIPLDMLFVAPDGRIITIARNAVPHDERPIPSGGPIRAVIEINGGLADKLGIQVGDLVRDRRVFGHG